MHILHCRNGHPPQRDRYVTKRENPLRQQGVPQRLVQAIDGGLRDQIRRIPLRKLRHQAGCPATCPADAGQVRTGSDWVARSKAP